MMNKGMKETWCKDDQFNYKKIDIVINEEIYIEL